VRGGGALKPAAVQRETQAVRGLTAAAARTHADIASFRFTQAVDLLLAVYARTGDSAYLAPARAVLDYLVDSGDAGLAASARDEPPELVRAGLLRDLVIAWSATGSRAIARRRATWPAGSPAPSGVRPTGPCSPIATRM